MDLGQAVVRAEPPPDHAVRQPILPPQLGPQAASSPSRSAKTLPSGKVQCLTRLRRLTYPEIPCVTPVQINILQHLGGFFIRHLFCLQEIIEELPLLG